MNKNISVSIIAMLCTVWLFNNQKLIAAEIDLPFVVEVDYTMVSKKETPEIVRISDLEAVSNIEIFYWYGCEPCYQVESAIELYIQQNPGISFRRTPLVARVGWRPQAYIQPLMMQLKALGNLPTSIDIYHQCLKDCEPFTDLSSILAWFSDELEIEEFPILDEELIWQQQKDYQKRADLFSITQVPTIIINETYQVNASQAKTSKRIIEIADFLLTK